MRLFAFLLLLFMAGGAAWAHDGDIPFQPPFLSSSAPAQPDAVAKPGQTLPMRLARKIAIDTDNGTWLSPDLSPDGSTILFEMLGDLYAVPAKGGPAKQLTSGMAFDSQPVFSPDGRSIAFISDRSGAENIWVMAPDGSHPRQISFRDDNAVFASPAWSANGKTIFVSRYRAEYNGFELWTLDVATGQGRVLIPVKTTADQPRDQWLSVLGAFPSADGHYLYFSRHIGENDFDRVPEWTIVRRDLTSGVDEVLVSAPRSPRPDLVLGTAFRPAVSPDGKLLVYGSRDRGRTGLRLLNLETREDRWLAFPVQQDELQASGWRDLLPRHVFTRDGRGVIANVGGKIVRIDLSGGAKTDIPFRVHTVIGIGPLTRHEAPQDTGPVRARIIQNPVQSPDGKTLAFSALGTIYTMALDGRSSPQPLTAGFQPSWSPDGADIVFVRWTARDAGEIWSIAAKAGSPARQLSDVPAYYTFPVYTPDGQQIVAIRSSNTIRMHSYMEYGALRDAELIRLPVAGGPARVIDRGKMGGTPHFWADPGEILLGRSDGVNAVRLDGSGRKLLVNVTGPGWYFVEGRAQADDIRISPDGHWALVQIAQQLHLIELPVAGTTLDLDHPGVRHRKLTSVGADFFAWADGGRTITWSVGSTFHRRALVDVMLDPADIDRPRDADVGGSTFPAAVTLPRTVPAGTIVLRGAIAITERGAEVIPNADILIQGDRILSVGQQGSVAIPKDATIKDMTGTWIVPGFIDTHDHIADIRRGILDFDSWGPLANLAYGVTTSFDPSTLSIDMLAYEDAVDAGLMVGSRIPSTGPAIFSFNDFKSYSQVLAVLRRYRDEYRLSNIKMYRAGNRRVRQWIAMACRELGLQPTTEGALSMKLDMSQIIDGYAGNEHALTAVPLYDDMLTLVEKSGVGWTSTLQITNGGPEGQDYFIVRDHPADDPKLNRFHPPFIVDMKTRTRTYRELGEYLFPRIAESSAKVQRGGGLIGIGSHGEMPGIGFHWELQAHVMGGMTPAEALHAGTIDSAAVIGREKQIGSIEPGKMADLVILGRDPLASITNTLAINAVMQGGILRDGGTMDELWPKVRPIPRRWYCDDHPTSAPDPCPLRRAQ
jgi:Tol biopolymer transport system component